MTDRGSIRTIPNTRSARSAAAGVRLAIFEEFSQLEPGSTNQGKGTGLGLAITKALVEEHGGSIHVQSSRGAGTTFEIRLGGDGSSFAQVSPSP
jgi:signal transduction histidine kinase